MKRKFHPLCLAILSACFLFPFWGTGQCESASGRPAKSGIEAVKALSLPEITILSATEVAENSFIPPGEKEPLKHPTFIRVEAKVDPQISVEVWLPKSKIWNGKFNGVGNGGFAGFINYSEMNDALNRFYATASTDTGHMGKGDEPPLDGTWALNRPDLIADFGHRGIHEMTVVAKAVITAYYGKAPAYSYFTGCSCGGGQGLSEAQRYPADYDGVVSGAPANYVTKMWLYQFYIGYIANNLDLDKLIPRLQAINKAVIEQLDAQDGLKDGLIETASVKFDPIVLLAKPGSDPASSLSMEEVEVFRKIYKGLVDPFTFILLMPGYEPGSEDQWAFILKPFVLSLSYFKYMVYNNPDWDWLTFDLTDPETYRTVMNADEQFGQVLNVISPDLYAFKRHGGKLIMYHGLADGSIPAQNTINYYNSVVKMMRGVENTTDFLRLFMIPGMGHCDGGPGCSVFDTLTALENWVEKGIAPDKLIGSHIENGAVTRTRPIYMYPNLTKWTGSGSIDDAASFVCRCSE
jgi:feruloyl esterase